MIRPFRGRRGGSQSISATTTSQSVTVPAEARSIRVSVIAAATVFAHVRIGKGPQTAATTDTVVIGGQSLVLFKEDGEDTVAVRTGASTATVHVQDGEGGI
jgi:hypothetical protein